MGALLVSPTSRRLTLLLTRILGGALNLAPGCVTITPELEGRLGVEGNEAWFAESGIFTVAIFGKDAEGGNDMNKPE